MKTRFRSYLQDFLAFHFNITSVSENLFYGYILNCKTTFHLLFVLRINCFSFIQHSTGIPLQMFSFTKVIQQLTLALLQAKIIVLWVHYFAKEQNSVYDQFHYFTIVIYMTVNVREKPQLRSLFKYKFFL